MEGGIQGECSDIFGRWYYFSLRNKSCFEISLFFTRSLTLPRLVKVLSTNDFTSPTGIVYKWLLEKFLSG